MSKLRRTATKTNQFKFDNGDKDLYDYYAYTDFEEESSDAYKTSDNNSLEFNSGFDE